MRELRGARRGHINRLAEHPRHPVVSPVVLIVVMAMADGPPNLVQARLLFTLRDGQPSIVLKNLFGKEQMSALADYVQASLVLNYNGREVG